MQPWLLPDCQFSAFAESRYILFVGPGEHVPDGFFDGLMADGDQAGLDRRPINILIFIIRIDIFLKGCYSESNIPATPLPQGMRNHGGFFIWRRHIGTV